MEKGSRNFRANEWVLEFCCCRRRIAARDTAKYIGVQFFLGAAHIKSSRIA